MPFAFVMGIELDDSFEVAELLGVKTFLNEFIAYKRLGKLIDNRVHRNGGTTLSVCFKFFISIMREDYSLVRL